MKNTRTALHCGFTLIETVIAIGVLAVLITGFMVVFAPAAEGIRKSISVQQADRLASTLEQELVNLRKGEEASGTIVTGFDKAYKLIEGAMNKSKNAELIFVYQYRGDLKKPLRADGTYEPYVNASAGRSGSDYMVVSMARRRIKPGGGADDFFEADLKALEGRIFVVKTKQLVFSGGQLVESAKDQIEDPSPGEPPLTGTSVSGKYPEAVISFSAEFYSLPTNSYNYVKTGGPLDPTKLKNPIFTRSLAVLR